MSKAQTTSASARARQGTDRATLRRLRRRSIPYLLILPGLVLLVLFFFGPAVLNIALSFQRISLFDVGSGGVWVGVANYVALLHDSLTGLALKNTVLYLTVATVVLRIALGLGLALLINASVLRRWRLSALARTLVIIPWTMSPVVAVAAWSWLLHPQYGALNQILVAAGVLKTGVPFLLQTSTVWWAIIAIVVWSGLPFATISLLAGLQAIPGDVYEAARIDGAGEAQILRHVTMPLLIPVITVIGLLTTIWTYNNFVYVWLSTQGGPGDYTQVLATQLYTEAFVNYRFGTGAAVGVIMSLIMAAFAIVYFHVIFKERMELSS